MSRKKQNQLVENVLIKDVVSDGRGVAHIDSKVVFVEQTAPGDVVDITIKRSKQRYAEAVVAQLKEASFLRTQPACSHFGTCGGCKWQHIQYGEQLQIKHRIVQDAFQRLGKFAFPSLPPVLGCEENFYYRNKLEFAFTNRCWLTQQEIDAGITYADRRGVGFHVPDSFMAVVDVKHCYLQEDISNQIRLAVKQFAIENDYTFFNHKEGNGFLRSLMIRTTTLGEVLTLFSFYENDQQKITALLGFIQHKFPQITSLQYVINAKKNDTVYDLETIVFGGKGYILEKIGAYRFKIGPKSFFQTNSKQAEKLYAITKEFAALSGGENVYDLYTGVGSIALYVSDSCKRVTGIEQVEAAIADAKENAAMNNVTNCSFYAGDVRMVLKEDFIAANGVPDVVITDPPRAGMHEDVVNTLLQLQAPKIVYVSCNPGTQARDIQLLSTLYAVERVQPVDMFPHTTHIENVALLVKKQ